MPSCPKRERADASHFRIELRRRFFSALQQPHSDSPDLRSIDRENVEAVNDVGVAAVINDGRIAPVGQESTVAHIIPAT